jgi:mitotic spindle assembly checkpoint protein MAD2
MITASRSCCLPDLPRNQEWRFAQCASSARLKPTSPRLASAPRADEPCAFEVLLYTDKDAKAPETMAETDAKFIANSEDMRLRSFSTSVHEVSSMVSYKVDDD